MAFDLRPLYSPFPLGDSFSSFFTFFFFRDTPYSLVHLIPSITRVDHDFQVSPPSPVIPVTDALTALV